MGFTSAGPGIIGIRGTRYDIPDICVDYGSHLVVTSVYPLCVRHDELHLFRELLEPTRWISTCGHAHFRIPHTRLGVLVIDGTSLLGCFIILQLNLMVLRLNTILRG